MHQVAQSSYNPRTTPKQPMERVKQEDEEEEDCTTFCGDFSLYLLRHWLRARESGEAYENVSNRNLKRNLKYSPTWAVPRFSPSFVFPRVPLFPLGVFGSFLLHVCMWVDIYIYVYTRTYIYILYVYMYICMYICMCVCLYIYISEGSVGYPP